MTDLDKAKQERGFPMSKEKTEVEKAKEQAEIELARAMRKDAAKIWAAKFSEKVGVKKVKGKQKRALAVIALDREIYLWLAENQPTALRQVQEALDGTSYCDYLPKLL